MRRHEGHRTPDWLAQGRKCHQCTTSVKPRNRSPQSQRDLPRVAQPLTVDLLGPYYQLRPEAGPRGWKEWETGGEPGRTSQGGRRGSRAYRGGGARPQQLPFSEWLLSARRPFQPFHRQSSQQHKELTESSLRPRLPSVRGAWLVVTEPPSETTEAVSPGVWAQAPCSWGTETPHPEGTLPRVSALSTLRR